MGRQVYNSYDVEDLKTGKKYTNLTRKEVSELCGIGVDSICNYIRRGLTYKSRWKINKSNANSDCQSKTPLEKEWDKVAMMFKNVVWQKRGTV